MAIICVGLLFFAVLSGFDTEDRTIFPSGHLLVQHIRNETTQWDTVKHKAHSHISTWIVC